MPGWDRYDVRGHLVDRFGCAVWVDNDVNLMVIGEARDGLARGENDVVYIKIGTGIGAGLIPTAAFTVSSRLCRRHRPHSCSPGFHGALPLRQLGCLEALAGAAALIDQAQQAGNDGRSTYLAGIVHNGRALTLTDISDALAHGDTVVRGLVVTGAQLVAHAAARIVNFYNPGLILIGGSVAHIGDIYLSTIGKQFCTVTAARDT